jgi:hypothetical protein
VNVVGVLAETATFCDVRAELTRLNVRLEGLTVSPAAPVPPVPTFSVTLTVVTLPLEGVKVIVPV